MSKKRPTKLALLENIASPRVIADIDRALDDIEQEWLDLLDIRKMAERRHGVVPSDRKAPAGGEAKASAQDAEQDSSNESVSRLISQYRTHEESPYKSIRHASRRNYETHLRRIERDVGRELIKNLDTERIERLYESWAKGGHLAIAKALIVMMRGLASFGARVLKNRDCRELQITLSELKFEGAKPRTEQLTSEQVMAIISKAHEMKLPAVALAQAFQFDCPLTQMDIIGQWVPETEPGESDIKRDGEKWLRGLLWSEIDRDYVLRHPMSRDGKILEFDLANAPTVMAELKRMQWGRPLPQNGPVIIRKKRGLPYDGDAYREDWRKVANAADIPKSLRSTDVKSRPATPGFKTSH
jgi:hypothetical protein